MKRFMKTSVVLMLIASLFLGNFAGAFALATEQDENAQPSKPETAWNGDVETATYAESGIDFNLYNYSGEINLIAPVAENAKKVKTALSQYFNFNGGGTGTYGTGTKDVGNLGKGHLTYERNLGADGAPVITWASVGNLDELAATEDRSIGYVFGKTNHFAVTAYEDILNTPFIYDPETGYYEYNSAKNAVDFDEESGMVYVRGYKEQGKASADANAYFGADDSLGDFFPFNSRIQKGADGEITFVQDSEAYKTADGTYYHYKASGLANPDYWFGASMGAEFYYPQDGKVNGVPMKYEFSGDDDVMVYIDGIYVMDLGGAHSRASGEIDFATGLVETWLDAANQTKLYPAGGLYDHKEWAADALAAGALGKDADGFYYDTRSGESLLIRYYPTTIYECYKAAYEEQGLDADAVAAKLAEVFVKIEGETVKDAYGNEHDVYRFRDYSVHTFNWFYLERHGWEANFYTKFNLPTIPQNSLTIEKVVEDSYDLVDDDALYAFEVWATDANGEATALIDTIQLKAGERAVIDNMIEKTKADEVDDHFGYIVKELGQVLVIDGEVHYSLAGYTTTWVSNESGVPNDGSVTTQLSAENSQIVVFTNSVDDITVNITKIWNDANNQDGKRPETITIHLFDDTNAEVASVTLKAEDFQGDIWTYTFEGLLEFRDGKKIEYRISEDMVDGYTAVIDGFIVTNTYTPEKTQVSVTKTWIDNDNQDGIRPQNITIRLWANGVEVDSIVVTEEMGWSYTFENLNKFANGEEIVYTITEDEVPGYTTEINGFDVTNTHEPEQTQVSVEKVWDDDDDFEGARPENITIRLWADGVEIDSVVVTEEMGWSYTFEKLPVYADGQKIVYTVTEDAVEGYEMIELSGDAENGFKIVNQYLIVVDDPEPPTTGDPIALVLALSVISVLGMAVCVLKFRKTNV